MNSISKIRVEDTEYAIKDSIARERIGVLQDETDTKLEDFRAKVAGVQAKGIFAETCRWCIFDTNAENRRSVIIKGDTHISLDIKTEGAERRLWFDVNDDTSFDLSEQMVEIAGGEEFVPGKNFYLYIAPDGDTVKLVVSLNSTFPNDVNADYTANNTRKIAWFSSMCADCNDDLTGKLAAAPGGANVGDSYLVVPCVDDEFLSFYRKKILAVTVGTYFDLITVDHPLAGFKAGDITPESVWCLTFRPHAIGGASVNNPATGTFVDIYKTSGKGAETTSEFGGLVTHTRQWMNFQDDLLQTGRRMLKDEEFTSASIGSNVGTVAAADDADAYKVLHAGGHLDTTGRAMISFVGIWEACGAGWEDSIARDSYGYDMGGEDGQNTLGYGAAVYVTKFGGARNTAVASIGPRCRYTKTGVSVASADTCTRGAGEIIRSL